MSNEMKSFKNHKLFFFFQSILVGELLVVGLVILIISISIILVLLHVEYISSIVYSQLNYYNQNLFKILFSLFGWSSITTGGILMTIGGCAAGQSSLLATTVLPYHKLHFYDVEHKTRIERLFKNANFMLLGFFLFIQGFLIIMISLSPSR